MKILISLSTARASSIDQLERTIANVVRSNLKARRSEYKTNPTDSNGKWISFNSWINQGVARWVFSSIAAKNGAPPILGVTVKDYGVEELLGKKLGYDYNSVDDLKQALASFLTRLAKPLGWYVPQVKSGRGSITAFFRPLAYSPLARIPKFLYHFSRVENKEHMLRKGVIPHRGEYDTEFMYPPRVHLLSKFVLSEINDLAEAIFSHGSDIESRYVDRTGIPIVVFKIDTSKLVKNTKIYHDPSFPNGLWTYTHIPPKALSVEYEG